RHMQPIVTTVPVFEIFIDVPLLLDAGPEAINTHIEALNTYLGIPISELMPHFDLDRDGNLVNPRGAAHRIVARGVSPDIAIPLTDEFRHIHGTRMSQRFFHDQFFAPQVIGFTRGDTRWGLEASFNTALTGAPGSVFAVHGEAETIPVRDGYTLVTTLDSDIQRSAQNIVDQTYREMDAYFVGIIVMDPNTAEILAMAQAPTFSVEDPFNPDLITNQWVQQNWDYLSPQQQSNEMNRMWQNFHIIHSYESGSVFKPIVMAAAMEEGVLEMDPNRMFHCGHVRHIIDRDIWCWTNHGSLSLRTAIYQSCNIAMIDIANLLTADNFYRYRGYFGFASRTGIDLLGENAVSSRAVMYAREDLRPVQLATSSMGQGFNATPIQLITAYSALINGGNMMQPFIVSHVVDNLGNVVEETRPTVVRNVISQEVSDFMRREMQHVVSDPRGTAHTALIPGHAIGGKTGTGQQGVRADGIDSLTYISFTPVENPEFLVLMVVDRVDTHRYQGAGRELGPRVRRLFEEIINLRGLPPSDGPDAVDVWQSHIQQADIMPNYSGQRLSDAVADLSNRSNGGFSVVGNGTIVSHTNPAAGRQMPQNSLVVFHMEPGTVIEGQMAFVPDLSGLTIDQATAVIGEVGLRPVLLGSLTPQVSSSAALGIPRTNNADVLDDEDGENAPIPAEPLHYRIYQQFPAPDTQLERGTMVMFRAR
ncbi:MAG: penicillin-binding transpeptidase domain-containing protein, partial [Defluviitaleaceae bacterium]|nr:penicillin-binding transpeptidase domain-containing protein [Defluviitaleaceae bacterium]